jgi:hypothetical protein
VHISPTNHSSRSVGVQCNLLGGEQAEGDDDVSMDTVRTHRASLTERYSISTSSSRSKNSLESPQPSIERMDMASSKGLKPSLDAISENPEAETKTEISRPNESLQVRINA